MKLTKHLKILGICAGIVLVLLVIIWVILDIRASSVLRNELGAMRKAGEPTTMAELAPPSLPEGAENAAPIYQEIGELLNDIGDTVILKKIIFTPEEITPEDIDKIRSLLAKNKEIIARLKDAARIKHCRSDVDYNKRAIEIGYPPASNISLGGQFLAADAIIKAKDGNITEALESCYAGSKLAKYGLREPMMLLHLSRIANIKVMLKALQQVLNQNNGDPQLIKALLNEVITNQDPEGFIRCWEASRCACIEAIQDDAIEIWDAENKRFILWSSFIFRPLRKMDYVYYLRQERKQSALWRMPYYESKERCEKFKHEIMDVPFYCLFLRVCVLGETQICETALLTETKIVQIGLALKLYQFQHGHYPDSLTALAPEPLKTIPTDPFSGQGFIYRKQDEGFIIYSVGENLIDDGGKVGKNEDQNDIIWKCNK